MTNENAGESFEHSEDSLAFGSRMGLKLKFLKGLSDEDDARFSQDLLWKLGDAFDGGGFGCIVRHAYEWQTRGYSAEGHWIYDGGPYASFRKED